MAASREPRHNAGNRMSKVLEEELDEDDFYKTTYGGFNEEEEDKDFHSDQEDSADEVDSDFDRSEHDEPISDEEDDKPKRKKKGISTKAYKEPNVKKATKPITENKTETKTVSESVPKKRSTTASIDGPMRKSSRRATATNSMMTTLRQKEREETDKKKKETAKKPTPGFRRLTQEELMAMAEKTERKNLKSLENYQRLEANRKKVSVKKRTFTEPTITYFSTSMPATNKLEKTGSEQFPSDRSSSNSDKNKVSRTFFIFSEDTAFKETFCYKKVRPPPKLYCPVTKKLARFVDPLTKLPYYDMKAFKMIRKAYHDVVNEIKNA